MPFTYVTVDTAPVMGIIEIVLAPRIAVDETGRFESTVPRERTRARRGDKQWRAIVVATDGMHPGVVVAMLSGVVMLDSKGRIVYANPAAERIPGSSFDQDMTF